MARAGYDPRQALAFWKRFAEHGRKRGGKPPEVLSTHPLDRTRIANLIRMMPKAMEAYKQPGDHGGEKESATLFTPSC